MKAFRLLVPALVLTALHLSAGGPGARYFADGLTIEAVVTKEEEGKLHLEVLRYNAEQEEEQILYGDLVSEGVGTYRFEQTWSDEADKGHKRTGKVKIARAAISYSGMKDDGAAATELPPAGGPWREVTAATVLKNARARYQAADKKLNAAWQQAKEEAGEAGLAALKESQLSWIDYRDEMAERVTWDAQRTLEGAQSPDDVDFKALPEYWRQLTSHTVDRTPLLRAWGGKSVAPGRSGIYRDSFGGGLTLEETKDGLHIHFNVVRGPTFHVGEIELMAKLKDDTASWTDADKPEGEKPAVITLKFEPNRSLTVEGENTGAYHGARASFDGNYFKVAPLKKKAGN